MTSLCKVIHVTRSPREAFDFVITPQNWSRWNPTSRRVKEKTPHPADKIGEVIDERLRFLGIPLYVEWEVRKCEIPTLWMAEAKHWAFQISVTVKVKEDAKGTRVERDVRYEMRNDFLSWLDRHIFTPQMEQYAQEAIERLQFLLAGPAK